ncbi:E3 ubiquitin-protein ligase UHRF2 [Acipenser ruthenus]|uniref:RING-type E3 ubiquitin transferase n=1 Tax=Acipenser ruthenus TaxID=7906 RepID=A0A662YKA1_ACIRT|nr:E3 ubiquitin-protein ligase UHRF2 [Acipenser ruthenus]
MEVQSTESGFQTCSLIQITDVSEVGVHRPHVGGIHGRSNDGSYSLVLAGGFEDEVDRGDEFTYTGSGGRDLSGNKRIGEHSFDQTLTHMNRALALNCDAPLNDKDGAESKNWRAGKPVRVIRSSKGRRISKYAPEEGNRYDGIYKYPEGYLEAMANKVKKDRTKRNSGKQEKKEKGEKQVEEKMKKKEEEEEKEKEKEEEEKEKEEEDEEEEEEEEEVVKPEPEAQSNGSRKRPQEKVIQEDEIPAKTTKLADKGEAFQLSPQQQWLIKEDCLNKKLWDEALSCLIEGPTCLQRSFRAEVYTCPACRHDLGKDYIMVLNKILQSLLDQFFPGYSKGR